MYNLFLIFKEKLKYIKDLLNINGDFFYLEFI